MFADTVNPDRLIVIRLPKQACQITIKIEKNMDT